ncbi:MAG TPA: hypothetical protein VIK72_03645 [Clostridiaceae bacterium]
MKIVKRLSIWILISIVIQCSILFYLDKYYFAAEGKVKTKSLVLKKQVVKEVVINLPKDADVAKVKVSYDGKYLAFLQGNSIKVMNLETGEIKNINYDATVTVMYYKWLPDRDRMFVAEKHIKNNKPIVKFSSCDVKKTEIVTNEIRDNNNNEEFITLTDSKATVEDIQISTLTNMIYVKLSLTGQRNSVYSMNVMGQMNKVNTGYIIGKMSELISEDRLVYEDLTTKKIYIEGLNPISIANTDLKIINIIPGNNTDVIYLGKNDSYKISKLYYGSLDTTIDKWKTIDLKDPVDINNIYISYKDKIYFNDILQGIITEESSGKQTAYKGIVLQMYDEGIISYDPGDFRVYKSIYK